MYKLIKQFVIRIFTALLISIFLVPLNSRAQVRMEPPNWWVGMQNHTLQLMLHGKDIGGYEVSLDYPGVSLQKIHTAKSSSYLFLDLEISEEAQPGNLIFELTAKGKRKRKLEYPLQQRNRPKTQFQGFDTSDVIYLITPDRFANGDPANDVVEGTREMRLDRSDDYARHGGDIQGIINGLDYLSDMGFTAIWPSPLLINDMPEQSYHGYAITDFYRVDPRFGDLEKYLELADAARNRGIKLIMDQVLNHCGSEHWWMKDLPFPDWINLQEYYEKGLDVPNTNHRRTVNQDPYASQGDAELMDQGWFVPTMPDLNVTNPYMGRYMIQNSIWWIETLGLGGIRQDTYPYINKEFSASWAGAIMQEYPNFSIVGEEWSYNPLLVGYWQDGANNRDGYESNLTSSMDFPLQKTLSGSLVELERWDTGLVRLYEALANDFYYAHPERIMLFGDNHDMDRIFTQVGESPELLEMALAYMLVAPRIPQIYYGTEIQMQNSSKPGDHGLIRTDFPGGWEGSPQNAFTGEGLSESQIKTRETLKKLLNFRKESEAIQRGRTLHFAPENGVYVLTRILGDQKVVLILNKNDESVKLNLSRFSELGLQGKTVKDISRGDSFIWDNAIELNHKGAYILTTSF
jgi:glycosidase